MNPDTHTPVSPHAWPLGAHLVSPRRGYKHHGIYAGQGRVIHYAGFSRGWWAGPVEEVTLGRFCMGRPVAVVDDAGARHDGAARVARARQRMGEDRYSLWTNNCEHFCTWCAHGIARSAQVDALRVRVHRILSVLGHPGPLAPSR
ncbi:lecithin retinol acyltransferase family protein [Variovorax sp. J22R133]|uniref:lecithin retinol acyltransferase family protein n=1 Tax=Variovorax brevis TaxID=3053503 RepID=UPI002577FC9F|nr:lecithin retinol acyltransferase family protein [Variovorax sp. J22R133]MDM0113634.1 lecithin retinol acyltransferase family protein [Variovorax sp. J22R133]